MTVQFKLKLAPTIATAIVLPILISLGFWQLARAELKQQKLDIYTSRSKQAPVELKWIQSSATLNVDDLLYSPIQVTGHYDTQHSFLVDNRVHQGEVGFYVITPLILDYANIVYKNTGQIKTQRIDKTILVNRGWIKGNRYRSELPTFDTPNKKISLRGLGYLPSRNFFAVDNVKIDPQSYPAVIQSVDFGAIKEALSMDVYPLILRLDPGDASGFVRDWQVVTSSPERSQGYAAQWFTMALVVIIIFLSSCFKFKREKTA